MKKYSQSNVKIIREKKAKYVIRVTGDSPLIDPKLINFLIKKQIKIMTLSILMMGR